MEELWVGNYMSFLVLHWRLSDTAMIGACDISHPKLLRKARKVRIKFEVIMKLGSSILSTGTDSAVCYNLPLSCPNVISVLPLGKRSLQDIFIKQPSIGEFVNIRSGLPTPTPNKCSLRPRMLVIWQTWPIVIRMWWIHRFILSIMNLFLKGVRDWGYGSWDRKSVV